VKEVLSNIGSRAGKKFYREPKKILLHMKSLYIIGLMFQVMLSSCFNDVAEKDAVNTANEINQIKAQNGVFEYNDAEFLVKAADGRLMDIKEGKLAIQKGTTEDIKEYGRLMVRDQNILLRELKKIANEKQITLPSTISQEKLQGNNELDKLFGEAFDKKFIKMMRIDHSRDVKLFEGTRNLKDEEIRVFAKNNLPMVQTHLDRINEIRGSQLND